MFQLSRLPVFQIPGLIAGDKETAKIVGPKTLGEDPDSGLQVTLRNGPYGPYVQLGEAAKGPKPRRQSLLEGMSSDDVDLDRALSLLSLPRTVGKHPESGETILAGVGRYGPYLKIGSKFVRLRDDDVLTIGLNRAVAIIADAPSARVPVPAESSESIPRMASRWNCWKVAMAPMSDMVALTPHCPRTSTLPR